MNGWSMFCAGFIIDVINLRSLALVREFELPYSWIQEFCIQLSVLLC